MSKLHRLPTQEIDAALIYYEEYFDEAGQENEQDVIEKLGPPSQAAAQILADFAIKDLDAKPPSTKKECVDNLAHHPCYTVGSTFFTATCGGSGTHHFCWRDCFQLCYFGHSHCW